VIIIAFFLDGNLMVLVCPKGVKNQSANKNELKLPKLPSVINAIPCPMILRIRKSGECVNKWRMDDKM
jgi:hypothetical protein